VHSDDAQGRASLREESTGTHLPQAADSESRLEISAVSLEVERPATQCHFAAVALDRAHCMPLVVVPDAEVPVPERGVPVTRNE